jgi:hypothetical protein
MMLLTVEVSVRVGDTATGDSNRGLVEMREYHSGCRLDIVF